LNTGKVPVQPGGKEVKRLKIRKNVLLAALALVLVFAVAQVASAAGFGFGGFRGKGPEGENAGKGFKMVEELNLTDQQVEQLKKILEETYSKTRDLKIKMMDLQHELQLLRLEQDEEEIEAKINEIKEVRDQIAEIMNEARERHRSILTEEQLEKMQEMRGMGPGPRGKWQQEQNSET